MNKKFLVKIGLGVVFVGAVVTTMYVGGVDFADPPRGGFILFK